MRRPLLTAAATGLAVVTLTAAVRMHAQGGVTILNKDGTTSQRPMPFNPFDAHLQDQRREDPRDRSDGLHAAAVFEERLEPVPPLADRTAPALRTGREGSDPICGLARPRPVAAARS